MKAIKLLSMSIILIFVLFLAGCGNDTLEAENVSEPAVTADTEAPAEPVEAPVDNTEPEAPVVAPGTTQSDVIEVTLDRSAGTAKVISVMDNNPDAFIITSTDADDIVFQTAQKYNKPFNTIRGIMTIDGKSYYDFTGNTAPSSTSPDETTSEPEGLSESAEAITYLAEKDDGYLRAVGCDFSTETIKFKLMNIEDEVLMLFKASRKPQISHSLRLTINGKTIQDFDCGEEIQPQSEIECSKSNVILMAEKYPDRDDKITVAMPGTFEQIVFKCPMDNNNETEVN